MSGVPIAYTHRIKVCKTEGVYRKHVMLPLCLTVEESERVLDFAHKRANKSRPALHVETFHGNAACGPYIELESPRLKDVEDVARMIVRKVLSMTDGVEVV